MLIVGHIEDALSLRVAVVHLIAAQVIELSETGIAVANISEAKVITRTMSSRYTALTLDCTNNNKRYCFRRRKCIRRLRRSCPAVRTTRTPRCRQCHRRDIRVCRSTDVSESTDSLCIRRLCRISCMSGSRRSLSRRTTEASLVKRLGKCPEKCLACKPDRRLRTRLWGHSR